MNSFDWLADNIIMFSLVDGSWYCRLLSYNTRPMKSERVDPSCFNNELVCTTRSKRSLSLLFRTLYSIMSGKREHYSSTSSSNALSRPVRRHLVNVYLTLAAMCAIAAASTQVGDYLGAVGSPIGSVGAVASVSMFRYTAPNSRNRWALLAVSFC